MSFADLEEVVYVLRPLADQYFNLGIQLGVKYELLKSIESKQYDQSRSLTETIILWGKTSTGNCSWSTLAKAVERIGGHDRLTKDLRARECDSGATGEDLKMADSKPERHLIATDPQNLRASGNGFLLKGALTPFEDPIPRRHVSTESVDDGYSSKGDLIHSERDSSGSEGSCFELAPGCGCTDREPCSLYKMCADGCPNPTAKRVPILRKKSKICAATHREIPLEEAYDFEDYDFEDYEESTKEVHKSFGLFVFKTSRLFKAGNVNIKELCLYLQGAYMVLKPRMDELSKATLFEDFFRIIVDQACSWFDYEIIKDLIQKFCVSAEGCLTEYEDRVKKYAKQRLPKGMNRIEVGGGARKGGKQLVIKIDSQWEEITFSDLNKVRGTFASILGHGLRRSDLYLADIRKGCIMMTFIVAEELAQKLFPSKSCLTSTQVKSLKDEGVISLECSKLSWSATSNFNAHKPGDGTRPNAKA